MDMDYMYCGSYMHCTALRCSGLYQMEKTADAR